MALVFVWHWCCLEVGCGQVVLGGQDCPGSWSSGIGHGKDLLGAVGFGGGCVALVRTVLCGVRGGG